MNEKNQENNTVMDNDGTLDSSLVDSINEKLDENAEAKGKTEGQLEEDPEQLMRENPMASIALSLYEIERILKGMLYIQNCNADECLTYRRENFYAIFGGPDPELMEKKELERLIELAKKEKADKAEKETNDGQ